MALAAEVGIDYTGLYASWKRRGYVLRSGSEAATLRHATNPDRESIKIAQAARRGTHDTLATREQRAQTRETRQIGISHHEDRLAAVLAELQIPFRQQAAIGPYNADFAFDTSRLVIEIDGGGHNPRVRALRIERGAFMTAHGWRVVHIETRRQDWLRVALRTIEEA